MKKLITVILILSLLLPAAAMAATGNSPFYGKWVAQKHGSTGTCDAVLYYLDIVKPSASAYFEFWLIEGGGFAKTEVFKEEMYSGVFEVVDDHIRVPTSGITYIEVYYNKEDDTLYMTDWPELIFARLP